MMTSTEKSVDQLIKEMPRAQQARTHMLYKRGLAEGRLSTALELEALYLNAALSDADIVTGLSAWIKETREGTPDNE